MYLLFCYFQIYAPSKHNNYGSKSFPGIDDAIEEAKNLNTADSWHTVQHEVWRVSRAVRHASLASPQWCTDMNMYKQQCPQSLPMQFIYNCSRCSKKFNGLNLHLLLTELQKKAGIFCCMVLINNES